MNYWADRQISFLDQQNIMYSLLMQLFNDYGIFSFKFSFQYLFDL